MENYNSTNEKPLDQCLKDIRDCDMFVGIYAFRYGYVPEGLDKSITHLEYEEAGKEGIPRLLFFIGEDAPLPRKHIDKNPTQIDNFRQLIQKEQVVSELADLKDFKGELSTSIHKAKEEIPGGDRKPIPSIPLLLPYLSNRSRQAWELENTLDDCEKYLNEKPLVCIIHGNEIECHDKFIKSLHEVTLPKMLEGTGDVQVDLTPVEWPSMEADLNMRYKKLTNDIARALTGNRRAEPNDLKKELDGRIAAQMIYFMLPVAAWKDDEAELIEHWLKYWSEFPDLNAGKKLMIFLCLKYKNIVTAEDPESKKYKIRNDVAEDFIKGLTFNDDSKISGLIMTELEAIEWHDIDNWIERHAPKFCDDNELRAKIMKFFESRKNQAVPMMELAQKLNDLLLLTQIREGFVP